MAITYITPTNNIGSGVSITAYTYGGSTTVTVTAKSKYTITEISGYYFNKYGDYCIINFDLDDDGGSATAEGIADYDNGMVINGTATKSATVSNSVENTTATATVDSDGTTVNVTLTADDGYIITAANCQYTDNIGDYTSKSMSVSDDGTTATVSVTTSDLKVSLSGTTEQATVSYDVNFSTDIENADVVCTSDDGVTTDIVVTANDGYIITSASVTYKNSSGHWAVTELTISDDGKTATGNVSYTTNTYTVSGTTTEGIITPDVTNNIENATFTATVDDGKLTVTVDAADGYHFDVAPVLQYVDSDTGDLVRPVLTLTSTTQATVTVDYVNTSYELTGTVNVDTVPTLNVDRQYLTNVTDNLNGDTIPVNFSGDIVFTANENCLLETGDDVPRVILKLTNGDYKVITGGVSDDLKTVTVTVDLSQYDIETFYLQGTAIPQTVVTGGKYGTINVYCVTTDDLNTFATKRFIKETDAETGDITLVDIAKYVNRIKRVFVTVDSTTTDVIKCGIYNTDIEVGTPNDDTVILDFGEITIPYHNNNVTDFDSEIKLFLPFIGFVSVDSSYIGRPVNLTYVVNIVTGDAVAKLSCDNILFDVKECTAATDVLFHTYDYNEIGGDTFDSSYLYGLKPFALVKWKTSLNNNAYNADSVRVVIGSLTGYNKVSEVSDIANEQLTSGEREMIMNQLKEGVYVEQSK
jgi:hypothetical protein